MQQWLHERTSMLRYTFIAYLAFSTAFEGIFYKIEY
jgi:hypothetical protein